MKLEPFLVKSGILRTSVYNVCGSQNEFVERVTQVFKISLYDGTLYFGSELEFKILVYGMDKTLSEITPDCKLNVKGCRDLTSMFS